MQDGPTPMQVHDRFHRFREATRGTDEGDLEILSWQLLSHLAGEGSKDDSLTTGLDRIYSLDGFVLPPGFEPSKVSGREILQFLITIGHEIRRIEHGRDAQEKSNYALAYLELSLASYTQALGRVGISHRHCQDAIRLGTEWPWVQAEAHVTDGDNYWMASDFARARQEFQAALALDEENQDAKDHLQLLDQGNRHPPYLEGCWQHTRHRGNEISDWREVQAPMTTRTFYSAQREKLDNLITSGGSLNSY